MPVESRAVRLAHHPAAVAAGGARRGVPALPRRAWRSAPAPPRRPRADRGGAGVDRLRVRPSSRGSRAARRAWIRRRGDRPAGLPPRQPPCRATRPAVRLFVALNLPDVVRRALWETTSALRDRDFAIKWVRPGGLPLTLRFFCELVAPLLRGQ